MTETIGYQVVRVLGKVEIRNYPPMVMATVKGGDDDRGFSILFDYISGNNEAREKVPMTAPVVSRRPGARIEMTAPVITDERTFSFVLPQGSDMKTVPRPLDSRIELISIPSRHVAALRFSGRAYYREVVEKEDELLTVLRGQAIRTKGAPFLMRYNMPLTPGFMRRNEVGVEVDVEDSIGGAER
ncbi:MAG: heme-binding protein [Methanomassiliicoccus sp.]|nr:heme-binding protein [Methanomassiliicoccus sp.]